MEPIDSAEAGVEEQGAQELLGRAVPRRVIVLVSVLIVALFACAMAAAFLVSIPDAVTCPFVLASAGGAGPVKAPLDGTLVRALAAESRQVRKGDALFVIRPVAGRMRSGLEPAVERAEDVTVPAPFDGDVLSVQRSNPGDLVTFGEELCRLARSDAPLVAELTPAEADLIRLRRGQQVQLLYEAFPPERFGAGLASVDWISPAAVADAAGEHFIVRATLRAQTLQADATSWPLRAGMRGTARVVTGRHTLIAYAFGRAFR